MIRLVCDVFVNPYGCILIDSAVSKFSVWKTNLKYITNFYLSHQVDSINRWYQASNPGAFASRTKTGAAITLPSTSFPELRIWLISFISTPILEAALNCSRGM